jgi:hypothetical protein
MKTICLAALCVFALAVPSWADGDPVPKTVEGGAHMMKEGGKDIGEGFKGVGRGIRDVFTGESSKENFREGKKIGTGFGDVGKGIGGVGRGAGRDVKKGFTGKDPDEGEAPRSQGSGTLREETLPE